MRLHSRRSILKVRMVGQFVPNPQVTEPRIPDLPLPPAASRSGQQTDPLSEVLALLKPESYTAGGFAVRGDIAIHFPKHAGIKCYAMLAGQCWLVVEGVREPVLLTAGDCFLLPRGLPFRLATDLSLEPVHYAVARTNHFMRTEAPDVTEGARYIVGGHFSFTGSHAEMLLKSLPPIAHIRSEADK